MTIKELEDKIKQAASAYYDNEPIMSDEEFDSLVRQLKELDPDNELINKVGFGSDEVSHLNDTEIPIEIKVSLPKYQYSDPQRIIDWCKDAEHVTISPKLDGMSLIVTYEEGKLKSVISRGNGVVGMDLTSRLKEVFPEQLPITEEDGSQISATIRGEIFIKNDTFEEFLSRDYANPRNATSGIVNANDSENRKYLTFLQHPQFRFIGLDTVYSAEIDKDDPLFIHKLKCYYEGEVNFPHDGIVLDKWINGEIVDSIAVKFPTEAVETEVVGIEWTMSPRCRMIPVVQLKPVQLYGTTVKRATGLHYSYIVSNKIGKGAIVKITKANEIIPHITEVVKPSEHMEESLPDMKDFKIEGLHLVLNINSSEGYLRLFSRNFLYNFLSFSGFKGEQVSKFLLAKQINTIYDFEDFISFMRANTEIKYYLEDAVNPSKMDDFIKNVMTKKIYTHELLSYVGFDGVGYKQSEKLFNNQEFKKYLRAVDLFYSVEGIPLNSNVIELLKNPNVHSALSTISDSLTYCDILLDDSKKEIKEEVVNTNPKVCLSGKFEGFTKKQLMETFNTKWNLVDSLDKDCKYLVVPDLSRQSSKVTKANNWGIPIIDFEQFKSM